MFKTVSKRAIQKAAEATGDLIDNKIADKITKISNHSPQNNWKRIRSGYDKKIPKEICISAEESQKIIDDPGLM